MTSDSLSCALALCCLYSIWCELDARKVLQEALQPKNRAKGTGAYRRSLLSSAIARFALARAPMHYVSANPLRFRQASISGGCTHRFCIQSNYFRLFMRYGSAESSAFVQLHRVEAYHFTSPEIAFEMHASPANDSQCY